MNIEQLIDKEIKNHFLELPEVEDITGDPVGIRKYLTGIEAEFNAGIPKNEFVNVEDRIIPGPDNVSGNVSGIPIRIYSPVSMCDNLPVLLWFHGGGFILGNIDTDDHWCATIAHEVQCVVISVDYRLAPEHPFPAGVNDCYAALLWLVSCAKNLKINKAMIAVGGVSAGGNMAASVALMTRDRKGPKLAFQFLVYPCLDDRHTTPSSLSVTNKRVWHRNMSLKAWEAYLGEAFQGEVSCYAAPSRARDLANLPPAYITAAELDLLRDEDIEYASKLMLAGVSTELHVFPRVIHGFEFFFQDTNLSKKTRSEYLEVLKKAFAKQDS
jgi:acetyl esterase/lipase